MESYSQVLNLHKLCKKFVSYIFLSRFSFGPNGTKLRKIMSLRGEAEAIQRPW
jgi:hypothetical protein